MKTSREVSGRGAVMIPDAWRPVIGTLAHNRSFTEREIKEYRAFELRLNVRSVVYRLLQAGLISRVSSEDGHAFAGFTPTAAGWKWVEEGQS